ncbi:DNA-binding transcriptional repressor AcrR [Vibrio ruber DSM 16370]|uniref:DNA-binding transcriptional repressor AcrR n=1 Tax=Vibrio ruber (strain DSM 16370 / JCM 11486 / BCRC 17186 / CECT 7878 / LMG 23124 / VR1) TaxID=1123498 RepID=A0A1R4LP48_VIBR1|nr:TetR/AcrR family transcriptional regulator [Vibrio ruber]SJN58295.1 DNA-binding transcriptional repressor AcrR [Vibrio ruber DSM 16370]
MNAKKLQIIEAAIRLFAQDGVGVSTAAIAKEASVSNGTLFNHFETKQMLIDDVYLFIKRNMADVILRQVNFSAPISEVLFTQWIAFAHWSYDHMREYWALNVLNASQLLGETVRQYAEELWEPMLKKLKDAQDSGTLHPISPELICITAQSYLHSLVMYANRKKYTRDETETIFREAFRVYWRGIVISASCLDEND